MKLKSFSAIFILVCAILGHMLSQIYPNSLLLCILLSTASTAVYLVLVKKYLKD